MASSDHDDIASMSVHAAMQHGTHELMNSIAPATSANTCTELISYIVLFGPYRSSVRRTVPLYIHLNGI
jgi:hypothetical protein